jgi:hypothetical protein
MGQYIYMYMEYKLLFDNEKILDEILSYCTKLILNIIFGNMKNILVLYNIVI